MRYSPQHKQETRRRIVAAAGKVFRRKGHAAAGVDDVMREAGLTAGGFYAHFKSKDDLFAAALTTALEETTTVSAGGHPELSGAALLQAIAAKYLSPAHRKLVERGCPMPPLLADLPRQSPAAREKFERVVGERLAELEPHFAECGRSPDAAWAMLALFVGGVSLARAVGDEALADRILAACRELLADALNAPANTPRKKSVRSSPKSKG